VDLSEISGLFLPLLPEQQLSFLEFDQVFCGKN